MKKKLLLSVVLIFALCVAAGAIWLFLPYEENHVGYLETEYGAVTVSKLAEKAPIVAVVTYLGDVKTIALKDRGIPATVGKVQVEEVWKGTLDEEVVSICFSGGTVLWKELHEDDNEGVSGIRGILSSLLRFKHRKDTVTLKFDDMVDAREGQRYLLFTGKDPENGYYTVMADAYGMRPLDENGYAYYKEMLFAQ